MMQSRDWRGRSSERLAQTSRKQKEKDGGEGGLQLQNWYISLNLDSWIQSLDTIPRGKRNKFTIFFKLSMSMCFFFSVQ